MSIRHFRTLLFSVASIYGKEQSVELFTVRGGGADVLSSVIGGIRLSVGGISKVLTLSLKVTDLDVEQSSRLG